MKPLNKVGSCRLRNYETGKMDTIRIMVHEVEFEPASRRSRRVSEHGGLYPLGFAGNGRSALVPYRAVLEGAFLEWIEGCNSLQNVVAWPVTVAGTFNGRERRYTPTYLVEIDPVPFELMRLGFGARSFVDCKPEIYRHNWDVQLTLEMLRLATGFPAVMVSEDVIELSILNEEQPPLRH